MPGYRGRKAAEQTAIRDYSTKSNESTGTHAELMVTQGLPGSSTKKALIAAGTGLQS